MLRLLALLNIFGLMLGMLATPATAAAYCSVASPNLCNSLAGPVTPYVEPVKEAKGESPREQGDGLEEEEGGETPREQGA